MYAHQTVTAAHRRCHTAQPICFRFQALSCVSKNVNKVAVPPPILITPSNPHSATMDENDFDQILQTDFHPNVHTADHHHLHLVEEEEDHHAQDVVPLVNDVDVGVEIKQSQQNMEDVIDPTLHEPEEEEPPIISPPVKRLPRDPESHLSPDEKKRIQREQNRMAAIRSRRKKQGQLCVQCNFCFEELDVADCVSEACWKGMSKRYSERTRGFGLD